MFEFAEDKYYQLLDVRDLFGRSKAHMNELYSRRVGCITDNIYIRPYSSQTEGLHLYVWFTQDKDGNFINRRLRTSEVSEVIVGEDIQVITANSIYVFRETQPKTPELRQATNLLEFWLGTGDYLFDKGVHYDDSGVPHLLTNSVHLGTFQDSCLIQYQETMCPTVARFFPHHAGVEFYDTIYGQQDYSTPMLIHNTGKMPLTVEFQFGGVEHIIEPGEDLLIHPPQRNRRKP